MMRRLLNYEHGMDSSDGTAVMAYVGGACIAALFGASVVVCAEPVSVVVESNKSLMSQSHSKYELVKEKYYRLKCFVLLYL